MAERFWFSRRRERTFVSIGSDEFQQYSAQSRKYKFRESGISSHGLVLFPRVRLPLLIESALKEYEKMTISNHPAPESTRVNAPERILQSALSALSGGKISEVVEQFNDLFTFNDHALALEFRDKLRLTAFFRKTRELFPDTEVEVVSTFECQDQAVAEWRLTATQPVPYGSISYRYPILLRGATIVQIENERITRWSDYYDQIASRRLAVFFTECIEH
jgi:hypothetical protein